MGKAPACPSTQQKLDGHGLAFAHPTGSNIVKPEQLSWSAIASAQLFKTAEAVLLQTYRLLNSQSIRTIITVLNYND